MKNKDTPCCAADAMRRIKSVEVDSVTGGLAMLDLAFAEVRELGPTDEAEAWAELLNRVKVYNYVPAPARGGLRRRGVPGVPAMEWNGAIT